MNNNVVSLQINTVDIMTTNRMERIVLDPIRTYACTRTARAGVRVTVPLWMQLSGRPSHHQRWVTCHHTCFRPSSSKEWRPTVSVTGMCREHVRYLHIKRLQILRPQGDTTSPGTDQQDLRDEVAGRSRGRTLHPEVNLTSWRGTLVGHQR